MSLCKVIAMDLVSNGFFYSKVKGIYKGHNLKTYIFTDKSLAKRTFQTECDMSYTYSTVTAMTTTQATKIETMTITCLFTAKHSNTT